MISAGDCHQAWRQLPVGDLDDIIGAGICLILAPHPDDESLGCGGLIAACVAVDRRPLVVILTDGTGSHPNSRAFSADRLRCVRAQETVTAVGHLGLEKSRVVFMNQPDTAAPRDGADFDAAVAALVSLIRQNPGCTSILAPWRYDPHCDHEAASLIAAAAAQLTAIRHVAYPVWGWTLSAETPVPQVDPPEARSHQADASGFRFPIQGFLPAKRSAIMAHQSQYGDLITDDPAGFRLPANLLSVFDSPFETFLHA